MIKWRNISHLLADMHISIQIKQRNQPFRFVMYFLKIKLTFLTNYSINGYLTNQTFEKFVISFINIYCHHEKVIKSTHEKIQEAFKNIEEENLIAEKLYKDLNKEKQV